MLKRVRERTRQVSCFLAFHCFSNHLLTLISVPLLAPAPSGRTRASFPTSVPRQLEAQDVDSSDDETWIAGVSTAGDQKAEEAAEEEFIDLEAPSEGELDDEEEDYDEDDEEEDEDEVAGLASKLGTMSFTKNPPEEYSIGFKYPFLMYQYADQKQKKVAIDLLVSTLPADSYNVRYNEAGTEILLYTKLPDFFTSTDRVNMVDNRLTENTSKIVALDELLSKLNVDTDHEKEVHGPPQRIKLPFKCDTKIPIEADPAYFESWELSDDKGETDQQFSMVLNIECESVEKPRRVVAKKAVKVFKTPRAPKSDANNCY